MTPAAAKTACAADSPPLAAAPAALWRNVRPASILLDATKWTGSQKATTAFPISHGVDVENGWIFHTFYGGFSIWDAHTNPAMPTRTALIGGWEGQFAGPWEQGNKYWPYLTEFTQLVWAIDAPAGDDSVAAIGAMPPVSFSIWNTANKSGPQMAYQDYGGKMIYQVYAANIAGNSWAFAASFGSDPGVFIYDMTAAKKFTSACHENRTSGPAACGTVYRGRLGTIGATKYVHGLQVADRHYLATGGGYLGDGSLRLWDVSTPAAPKLLLNALAPKFVNGVALWSHAGRHLLAARVNEEAHIYDVTTCLSGGACALGAPVWKATLRPWPQALDWQSVTFSRSDGTPILYFGDSDTCVDGDAVGRHEYLLDVSDPANPRDVVDPVTIVDTGVTVDYWSWYYSDTKRGWQHMSPRNAVFNGKYLYRAAGTLFDVHEWTGGVPTAAFSWAPTQVWAGEPVTFTDGSSGSVTGRNWTFEGGAATGAAKSAPQAPPPAEPAAEEPPP